MTNTHLEEIKVVDNGRLVWTASLIKTGEIKDKGWHGKKKQNLNIKNNRFVIILNSTNRKKYKSVNRTNRKLNKEREWDKLMKLKQENSKL